MITLDPIERLELLKEYMHQRIDRMPGDWYPFQTYLHRYYPEKITTTIEYAKAQATHCYYCDRLLRDEKQSAKDGARKTADHFYPRSKNLINHRENRFVICCNMCNVLKGCLHPATILKMLSNEGFLTR